MIGAPDDTGDVVMLGMLPILIGLISMVVSVANIIWTWVSKGQTATSDRVKKVEEDSDRLELRVLKLESDYQHLPTKDDISGLKVQLENVLGKIGRTETELVAVNRVVGRIDNFLREKQ